MHRMDRLSHDVFQPRDGLRVGVTWGGRGIPLVLLHGFGAETRLYAQSASRLTDLGVRVIGIDLPGHGESPPLPGRTGVREWAAVVADTLDHLGVRHAVVAGHSTGGRVAAELAVLRPSLVSSVVLIDAIVGASWDRRRDSFLRFPPALLPYSAAFVLDCADTAPLHRDRDQARKLRRLATSMVGRKIRRPRWTVSAVVSVLRSPPSVPTLDRLRSNGTHVTVLHGERDLIVPLSCGRDAARRLDAELVVVRGARHSWPLDCPQTLPVLVDGLLAGGMGDAVTRIAHAAGVRRDCPTLDEMESVCYRPDAPILGFPTVRRLTHPESVPPRYDWTVEPPNIRYRRVSALG